MVRTVTILEKKVETKFGTMKLEAHFIQDVNDKGYKSYELQEYEQYDGCKPNHVKYTIFDNKESGNEFYVRLRSEGYEKVDSDTFTPSKIDADGNFLEE